MTGLLMTGCTSVFFFPDRFVYATPDMLDSHVEEVTIPSAEGVLHGWWLKAKKPRGSIFYLHGNAQNLTSHVINVAWLPKYGYNVLIFDYRGYGQSSGTPDLAGAIEDSRTAYQWFLKQASGDSRYILGQSLGGALSIRLAAEDEVLGTFNGLISDAAFASYPGIAKEKLNDFWLTWAFQYPLSCMIPGKDNAINYIDKIGPAPLLIFHSTIDEVIPVQHGVDLFNKAHQPKQFIQTELPHGATFMTEAHRADLLKFLYENRSPKTIMARSAP